MTVSYSRLVANGSSFGCFWSILLKWRGSVYKLIWRELLVYLIIYFTINFTYRYALTNSQQRTFELIREYFKKNGENIPMVFVMGFYVTLVVKRWWEQYRLLPWPDTLALFVSAAIAGVDERGRLMRRNIVRYAILAYVITLKHVSVRVKKRFPSLQHLVDAGIMLESEKKIVEMMDARATMSKYWMPLVWATNIINRARKEGMITSDHLVQTLLVELSEHRRRLGALISYDTVCVPLVYTQVVTLSVYIYFLSALMGAQFIVHETPDGKMESDIYFPLFTVLQFCFYIGWLKVAEVLIGPFGEDDDDIELNWLIDRHIKAAYMIVDEMHEEHPELLKDQYWDEVVPRDLPYTVASEHYRRHEPKGSAEFYKVKETEAIYANLQQPRKSINPHPDDAYADYESVDTPLVERRKNWFQRQMQRMGSVRSSSIYSSGLFGRTRHNSSVYSTPDQGLPPVGGPEPPTTAPHPPHKMSIYDRLIGRKSTRRGRPPTKLNMANIPANLKNRPRIPTPDVTKEPEKESNHIMHFKNNNNLNNNLNNSGSGNTHNGGGGMVPGNMPAIATLQNTQIQATPTNTTSMEIPVVQVVLSPIQEVEGQSTVTSASSLAQVLNPGISGVLSGNALAHVLTEPAVTLAQVLSGQATPVTVSAPGSPQPTAALAQAVLSPTLTSAGIPRFLRAVTLSPIPPRVQRSPSPLRVTEIHSPLSDSPSSVVTDSPDPTAICDSGDSANSDSACGSSSSSTASITDDRSRKASVTSQTRRSEVYV